MHFVESINFKRVTGILSPITTYASAEDALREYGIAHINVRGSESRWKGLADELTERLGKKVDYLGPSTAHLNRDVHLYATAKPNGQNQDYKSLLDEVY